MANTALQVAETDATNYATTQTQRHSERVRALLRGARSESTRRAYKSLWGQFATWLRADWSDARPLPLPVEPRAVLEYIAHLTEQGRAPSTIAATLAAIAHTHRHAGLPFDTSIYEGALDSARRINKRKTRQAKPATLDVIAKLPPVAAHDLRGLRDRAVILLGFWCARRRSELAGLDVAPGGDGAGHIERVTEGLILRIGKSKANQQGELESYAVGHGLEPDPIAAVEAWLAASGITSGPLFRQISKSGKIGGRLSGHSINKLIKDTLGDDFTGHALRRGYLTTGAREGLTALELARQSGHKSMDVIAHYVKEAELFTDNSAAKLMARRRRR